MPALKRLTNLLQKQRVSYNIIQHRKVYTTYDAAQTMKTDIKSIAKTILVKTDARFAFVVIPGHRKLDIQKLKKIINTYQNKMNEPKIRKIQIANEGQIRRNFTKTVGALAPFGSLYKIPTFVDNMLLRPRKIIINAGSFTESIELSPAAYRKTENVVSGSFSKAR